MKGRRRGRQGGYCWDRREPRQTDWEREEKTGEEKGDREKRRRGEGKQEGR